MKKISPLTAIILGAIIFSGLGLATWYWTSSLNYSFEFSVTGWMDAKVIDPDDLHTYDPQNIEDMRALPVTANMTIHEGTNRLYVLCIETNALDHQITVTCNIPTGATLEVDIIRVWYRNNIPGISHDLDIYIDTLTTFDGTQTTQLDGTLFNHEPDPDPNLGDYKLIELIFRYDTGSLGPGAYTIDNILIIMGDTS